MLNINNIPLLRHFAKVWYIRYSRRYPQIREDLQRLHPESNMTAINGITFLSLRDLVKQMIQVSINKEKYNTISIPVC